MAIYHLNVKNGSRGGGQSAQAHAAYIERAGKYGLAGPDGVERDAALYCESGHMPAWAVGDDLAYWQAADVYERANGQLYKEVEFALPVELPAQAGAAPGGGLRPRVDRCRALTLHPDHPRRRGDQPARSPDDQRAGQ